MPRPAFKAIIQRPGLGTNRTTFGTMATNRYGLARPNPRKVKTTAMSITRPASANAIAVPRNGAEQGVAMTAPKNPVAKSAPYPAVPPAFINRVVRAAGKENSNSPNRFAVNRPRIRSIRTRNVGLWNWSPQPTATPIFCNAKRTAASAHIKTMTPAAAAKKPALTWALPRPSDFRAEDNLIDRTGSTQGMAFRIKPPRKAMMAIQIT